MPHAWGFWYRASAHVHKHWVLLQGVGNPHAFAAYREGDTVLDLGCGMGVDTRIAAARVGESGRAVGIDLR